MIVKTKMILKPEVLNIKAFNSHVVDIYFDLLLTCFNDIAVTCKISLA